MNHSFTPFPVLETERLSLRAISLGDTKAIFKLRTNREINKFIKRNEPKNLSEANAFIDKIMLLVSENDGVFWVIERKQNNQVIGTIGLRNFEADADYAEIGYELNPDDQKNGFMSEAFQKVLSFGFDTMTLKTIEAFTHKNNKASIALLEKHNFVLQPERRDVGFDDNRIFKLKNKNQS